MTIEKVAMRPLRALSSPVIRKKPLIARRVKNMPPSEISRRIRRPLESMNLYAGIVNRKLASPNPGHLNQSCTGWSQIGRVWITKVEPSNLLIISSRGTIQSLAVRSCSSSKDIRRVERKDVNLRWCQTSHSLSGNVDGSSPHKAAVPP